MSNLEEHEEEQARLLEEQEQRLAQAMLDEGFRQRETAGKNLIWFRKPFTVTDGIDEGASPDGPAGLDQMCRVSIENDQGTIAIFFKRVRDFLDVLRQYGPEAMEETIRGGNHEVYEAPTPLPISGIGKGQSPVGRRKN
jgi:hypothetical protein